jgi:DNA-binding XRE family transcriptional regulator
VADLLGVARSTIEMREGSDDKIVNASPPPDLRYKVPPAAKREIAERVRRRWTQQQVADLLGVERSTLAKQERSDVKIHNASPPPDLRYKIPPAAKREIAGLRRRVVRLQGLGGP